MEDNPSALAPTEPGLTTEPVRGAPKERRTFLERAALAAELDALAAQRLPEAKARAEMLALLKQTTAAAKQEVRQLFEEEAIFGRAVASSLSNIADEAIAATMDHIVEKLYPAGNPSAGERLAVFAVGGYGRGELAPQSDIDLLFLLPYKVTARHEQIIEALLYLLWDLGLKVGHATRSLDETIRQAKADMTIRTGLLERRLIWGDGELAAELDQRFTKQVQSRGAKGFLTAKLDERDTRHERQGNSRYTLEPNIKEGKGGLRDLQSLAWIAKYLYKVDDMARLVADGVLTRDEAKRYAKAESFLWTLRCHLHYLTGRGEERLTFDLQTEIAPRMGYRDHAGALAVERLMKHYFLVAKDVGDLTRVLCASLEARHMSRLINLPALVGRRRVEGFQLEGHRLTVKEPGVFRDKPMEMLRIFKVAQDNGLDIHPEALRWISRHLKRIDGELREDPQANALFLDMMTAKKDPEITLRRMNEAGVFGRFVPEFGRVVAQMQFNRYHHYTVDEHTIFAIGILHKIERGQLRDQVPIASEVVHKVLSRRVLYVALLLHDIAKGRKGDHSEVGARIALQLCPRLGLSAEETETVAWLVTHHLAMSHTAFTRDMDDPQTIASFATLVQSMERLRLLLVLTVADIRAVGPGTWTAWKAALLRDLYWRTEELLSGGPVTKGRQDRIAEAKERLSAQLADWPKKDLARHLASCPPSYWLAVEADTQLRHAQAVREARQRGAELIVDTRVDRYRDVTEVTVYTADTPGLFSGIAGAIATTGGSIDGARIFTLSDGMALDSFYVTAATGGAFDSPARLAKLSAAIEQTLSGARDPAEELAKRKPTIPSRLRVFTVAPRVLIDNNESASHTVIEVNGRDRPGLLFNVTAALTEQRCTIQSAKISTFGVRVVDVFYIQNARGGKITGKQALERLRKALEAALAAPDGAKPAERRKAATSGEAKAPKRQRKDAKAASGA